MSKIKICMQLSYLLILMLVGILSSCQQARVPKIGFLIPNLKVDRYAKEKVFFTERIVQLGGEALVASAENDDMLQIKQAKDMIAQGADVLVINSINRFTAAAIVRIANEEGVKVIAYDRLISNSDLDYYISFDSEKAGELMAEYAVKKCPAGNYLIFGGDKSDLNALLLKNGQLNVLKQYIGSGKIKVEYSIFVEDWSEANAQHEIKNYLDLSTEQPVAIISSYDGMSSGIIRTLKEYGLEGKVLLTGQDAEITACQNIVKGYQSMTIFKSFKKLAYSAADLSMNILKSSNLAENSVKIYNGKIEVPSILLEPIVVDINNLKTTVIAEGLLSESDVYN